MESSKTDNQKLIDAFSDPKFQEDINRYRFDIEKQLVKFIDWLLGKLKPSQKIFRSPESRIKSIAGFTEKIKRKDYIHKWSDSGKTIEIQDEILAQLPDLIGFRLTCFFMDDEEVIYNKLREYYEEGKFENTALNFNEGTKQQNGHKIYKVTGKYKVQKEKSKEVSFEVQIKSVVHNIWGEVEHKTIYKRSQYAVDLEQRKTITEEIFNILKASDQQLLVLFTNRYTQQDLVCGLFAEQTRKEIEAICNTEYLAGHYKSFFDIFLWSGKNDIWNYVSSTLVEKKYEKRKIEISDENSKISELAEEIKNIFVEYYLQIQYNIAQKLYAFADYDTFVLYLAQTVMRKHLPPDEDQELIEDDVFSEEEDKDSFGIELDYKEQIMNLLKEKLPNALKERK